MANAISIFDPFFSSRGTNASIDRLVDEFLTYSLAPKTTSGFSRRSSKTRVKETDTTYEVSVVAPGHTKESFNIALEKNVLTVSCDKSESDADTLAQGAFKHSWRVPEGTDATAVSAKYDAGILNISIEKPAEEQIISQTIAVN